MAAVQSWLREINMQNGTGEKRMGKNCKGAEQGMFRSIQIVGQTERYMRVFRKKKKADIPWEGKYYSAGCHMSIIKRRGERN